MRKSRSFVSTLFLFLSFLGLILIAVLTYLSSNVQDGVSWRKPVIGAVFSIVCILGIVAGVSPTKCSRMFHFRRVKQEKPAQESTDLLKNVLLFRGHHPDCGSFRTHVLRVSDRIFCAGCVGLILGAIISLLGVALYFFTNLSFWADHFLVFWIGFIGVSCGLLQYHLFNWGRSSVHLFVNTSFVFGVFLLLSGVDAATHNALLDFYLVVLSVFWIYTRILLSQIDHKRICFACHMEECEISSR